MCVHTDVLTDVHTCAHVHTSVLTDVHTHANLQAHVHSCTPHGSGHTARQCSKAAAVLVPPLQSMLCVAAATLSTLSRVCVVLSFVFSSCDTLLTS